MDCFGRGRARCRSRPSAPQLNTHCASGEAPAIKPGVFSQNQMGTGQGAIRTQNFSVNSPTKPTLPGSVVQILMTVRAFSIGLVTMARLTVAVVFALSPQPALLKSALAV